MRLRAVGPLARRLGGGRVALELPAPVAEVLAAADPRLVREGRPLPLVFRDGRRLEADAAVRAGEVLDLVMAIAGGSGLRAGAAAAGPCGARARPRARSRSG